jgi:hypothetical protein
MGCLTFPFRVLGFLLILALVAAGWLYRDRLLEWGRGVTGTPRASVSIGTPSPAALARARAALARLEQGQADSVVLDADASASLMAQALGPVVGGQMDSLRVRLSDGRVGFDASLRTARLPRELLGPLAIAVRSREPIAATGAVRMVEPGMAEWDIDRLSVRDIPLPRETVPRLLARAFGDSARRTLPLALPQVVRELRVRPEGVTLYSRSVR